MNALYGVIADAAPQKTTAEWLALMDERDIPCGRVNHLGDLFAEPHLSAVGLFEAYSASDRGRDAHRSLALPGGRCRAAPRPAGAFARRAGAR